MRRSPGRRMSLPVATSLLMSAATAALAAGAQAEDFFLDIPAGAVRHLPAVRLGDRSSRLELTEDLVVRGPTEREEDWFGDIRDLAVDDDGNLYVLDTDRMRVAMFGADGAFLRELGRSGQGPGEFTSPRAITASGDLLWLSAANRDRLIAWDRDGALVRETTVEGAYGAPAEQLLGLGDGSVLAKHELAEADLVEQTFVRLSREGSLLRAYVTLPAPLMTTFHAGPMLVQLGTGVAAPQAAADPARARVYVTPATDYQVVALGLDGTVAWAVDVPWPTGPPAEADKEQVLSSVRRSMPDFQEDDVTWPPRPAISRLLTDGRGRVYVFPYVSRWEEGVTERAVDVYSPDGELLDHAIAPNVLWRAARGDYVYAIRENGTNGAYEAVRYRLRLGA